MFLHSANILVQLNPTIIFARLEQKNGKRHIIVVKSLPVPAETAQTVDVICEMMGWAHAAAAGHHRAGVGCLTFLVESLCRPNYTHHDCGRPVCGSNYCAPLWFIFMFSDRTPKLNILVVLNHTHAQVNIFLLRLFWIYFVRFVEFNVIKCHAPFNFILSWEVTFTT